MTAFRLPDGGRIDRSQKLRFHFDGRPLEGYQGDTLASALLANDVFLVGRSFKYHRPRGVMSAGAEETNALVAVGEGGRLDTNSRATMVELYDGLVAQSLNRWPSLGFDVSAINGWLAPFLVAGFYYKTFMWPRRLWQSLYEPAIRRMAGIGAALRSPIPTATTRCTGTATCWSSAADARACSRRSPPRAPARASCSATNRANRPPPLPLN